MPPDKRTRPRKGGLTDQGDGLGHSTSPYDLLARLNARVPRACPDCTAEAVFHRVPHPDRRYEWATVVELMHDHGCPNWRGSGPTQRPEWMPELTAWGDR